ncbi:hypothetical protein METBISCDRAFT_23003 [Metschnikowia bicuspidata]|uniref:Kinetochore protein Spc24 n=1 Tax=Metschnikowia bicuspidata TaxID=27322 RepID=A0A4V1J344_9ASCO|nr:hypothetical protein METBISCDRAFT_23003 [Metschnikowia bicuspidata]
MNNDSPAELIRMTASNFAITPDTMALDQILRLLRETACIRALAEDRLRQQIEANKAEVQRMNGQLASINRPTKEMYEQLGVAEGNRDPEHDDVFRLLRRNLLELDNRKIALAKQLTELQSTVNQLRQRKLVSLKRQEEMQKLKDDAMQRIVAKNYNSTSMKIALYKKLGVHIQETDDGEKILVLDKLKSQASVLHVDDKYSKYFVNCWVWDHIRQ